MRTGTDQATEVHCGVPVEVTVPCTHAIGHAGMHEAVRQVRVGDVVRFVERHLGFPDDLRAYPAVVVAAYPDGVCDLRVLRLYDCEGVERVDYAAALTAGRWSW